MIGCVPAHLRLPGLNCGMRPAARRPPAPAVPGLGWAIRSGGLVGFVPNDSPFPRPAGEPRIDSPVPGAVRVAGRLRAGAGEPAGDFAPVSGFSSELLESGGHLIDWPS